MDPARLCRVYYSIDPESQELTKNLEFAVDYVGDRIPGCMNMTSSIEWESPRKFKLTHKSVTITSDELRDVLQARFSPLKLSVHRHHNCVPVATPYNL